jgi:hypothetical protein
MRGSGIRSVVGAVVGLCSRWEAGKLLQRAYAAMGLGDCTVGTWGCSADPVSSATLFDFFTEDLADWRHPLGHEGGLALTLLSVCKHAQKS